MDDTNFQIKNITLSNAIKNWFFPPEKGAAYKARAQSAVRLLLKQTFELDHRMDSNATSIRVDAIMRKIKAERGMNDMDFIRYMRHLNSVINILNHKQVFDNHGQATITCMPPGTAEHLEAAVVEMVYDCQEQKQDDIQELTEHFNQQRAAAATDYQNNLAVFNNSVKNIEKAREQFKFYKKIMEIGLETCRSGGNIHTIKRIKQHSLDLWILFLNQMPHHMAVLTQNFGVIEFFVQEGVLHKDALEPKVVTAADLKDLELLNAASKNKITLFVNECTKNLNQEHKKLLDGLKKLNDSEKQINAAIDSELRKSLEKLEAHYAEQIKNNIQILAAYDSNFEKQAIAYESERQAMLAAQREAQRTMKRKKKQAIYKGIAGVVVGAIVAPFAPALTMHIYSGIPALGLTVIEGAAFGAISSAVAGGNIEKGALQGGICAGIGGALSSSTKFAKLAKPTQAAIRAVPVAAVSTAINGGNPLKNIATAVLTSYVGESLVPSNTTDAATKAAKELTAGQVFDKALHNVTRSFVEGVPTALLRGENLGAAIVAGSIGAFQSGASSAAGDVGSRVAEDLKPKDYGLGNTAFLTAPKRQQHEFPVEADPKPTPVKQAGKPISKAAPKTQEPAKQAVKPKDEMPKDNSLDPDEFFRPWALRNENASDEAKVGAIVAEVMSEPKNRAVMYSGAKNKLGDRLSNQEASETHWRRFSAMVDEQDTDFYHRSFGSAARDVKLTSILVNSAVDRFNSTATFIGEEAARLKLREKTLTQQAFSHVGTAIGEDIAKWSVGEDSYLKYTLTERGWNKTLSGITGFAKQTITNVQHKVSNTTAEGLAASLGRGGADLAFAAIGGSVLAATPEIVASSAKPMLFVGNQVIKHGTKSYYMMTMGAERGRAAYAVVNALKQPVGKSFGASSLLSGDATKIFDVRRKSLLFGYESQRTTISASSPSEIYRGYGNLSGRQQKILEMLPGDLTRVKMHRSEINVNDLASLTAYTGDEFAIFTRGSQRMVVRGNHSGVNLSQTVLEQMQSAGFRWSAHTHPGVEDIVLNASGKPGDRLVLEIMKQERSLILNSAANKNVFDMTNNIRITEHSKDVTKIKFAEWDPITKVRL